jgi:hypothetical protein
LTGSCDINLGEIIKENMGMEWIFPCGLDEFDIHGAFREYTNLDWECTNKVSIGDIVFIYIGAPESAIRYKCRVVDNDKDFTTIDDEKFGGNKAGAIYSDVVEITLEEAYPEPGVTDMTLCPLFDFSKCPCLAQCPVPIP